MAENVPRYWQIPIFKSLMARDCKGTKNTMQRHVQEAEERPVCTEGNDKGKMIEN